MVRPGKQRANAEKMDVKSNYTFSTGGAAFDDGLEDSGSAMQVYRVRSGLTHMQSKSDKEVEATYETLQSIFRLGLEPVFTIDPHNLEATNKRIIEAIEAKESLVVAAGYFIPQLKAQVSLGKPAEMREKPLLASDFQDKVSVVAYEIGRHGKAAKAMCLVNPDKEGVCMSMNIPSSKGRVFFNQHLMDLEEGTKKVRERSLGARIGAVTDPSWAQEVQGEAKDNGTDKSNSGKNKVIYKAIPGETFSTKARLARLAAKLDSAPVDDPSIVKEIIAEAEGLALGHEATAANHGIIQLLCVDEPFERDAAKLALVQIQNLWPELFRIARVSESLDVELLFRVGYALRHQLKNSVVVEYATVKPFLGMVVILGGAEGDVQDEAWGHRVKSAHDAAAGLFCGIAPTASDTAKKPIKRDAALTMVKRDLESIRKLLKDAATSINQGAARAFDYKFLPRLIPLGEALNKLANCHEYNAARAYIEAIYRNIAQDYERLYGGVILRAVHACEGHVDELEIEEEDEGDEKGGVEEGEDGDDEDMEV
ncbi:hypothetical protein HER10_EVM0001249 [Colletotrichum scovillei]|uniref:uncharacterized protein n=1 Tax=Colletotrichum scovillei TaxID=1209932 RepID=UPI0015C386E6|nr:uncharacterized protein HER10_EVM0001249 [Colletotrichum scovillei]KAF4780704.1 hypothetical protein HER10_EVM0001249 [Colletotrichum scovillei]